MSNTLAAIMPKILARGLMVLREQAIMARLVNGDYSAEAKQKGATIDVPIPTAIAAGDVTPAATPPALADTTPTTVAITLSNWKEARFHLSDKDLTEIDQNAHFIPMQLGEAIRAIVNAINLSVHQQYKGIYGYVGTAGTTPFNATTKTTDAINARKVLNAQLCPRENRRGVLNFDAEANALALAEFADASQVGNASVKIEGEIGRKFGIDWYTDDQVLTHTAGTITTGLAAKAATAQAVGLSTIVATTAASSGACALKTGDIILFAGDSQTYTLTADATQAAAATDVNLAISPPLKVALVGGEAITVKASHAVNLVFHRDAFALAMRTLAKSNVDPSNQTVLMDPKTGLSLRLEASRVHKADSWSVDALWGTKLVRAALATRVAG